MALVNKLEIEKDVKHAMKHIFADRLIRLIKGEHFHEVRLVFDRT